MLHHHHMIGFWRFTPVLLLLPLHPLHAAHALLPGAKASKLLMAVQKKSGFQMAKWATRCINRHARELGAEVVDPRYFQRNAARGAPEPPGVHTVLFVRDPVDLALSHFVQTRGVSREDDYILPGTAREVQEGIAETLKANVTQWMQVDKRESYQEWLRRVKDPVAVRAHLAHLLPEMQTMEEAMTHCNHSPTLCQRVSLDSLRNDDGAYMRVWAQLLDGVGTQLYSAKEVRLKDCLARKAPSAFRAANATSPPKRPVRRRQAVLQEATPLTARERAQLTQLATSIDKDLYHGRFAQLGKSLVTVRI